MPNIDYSKKMPDTIFTYDEDFYTDDLPDPQIDPVLPGARVPLKKVGIAPVDLPVKLRSRSGGEDKLLQAEASLYCSLDDPMAKVFRGTMQSVIKVRSRSNLSERLNSTLQSNIEKQMNIIEKNFTFLASVGSTSPFIGLFGTVWGIMNSFQSIAISRNTSLAIVAPGIAEALFATALGLLAAIPAVIAYNKFNNDSLKYSQKLENFSKRFLTII